MVQPPLFCGAARVNFLRAIPITRSGGNEQSSGACVGEIAFGLFAPPSIRTQRIHGHNAGTLLALNAADGRRCGNHCRNQSDRYGNESRGDAIYVINAGSPDHRQGKSWHI